MVRRHEDTAFMGGAHVFPGGRVDAADGDADASWCDGIDHAIGQLSGMPPADALAYQRRVPAVRVANELVNHWFDDFYHPGSPQFAAAFSGDELAELAEFHRAFDAKADGLSDELEALLASSDWRQVASDANAVLDRLGWTGLVAKYDD